MSDFQDRGLVKVIALKKTGSSQLRRCFEEKVWERGHVDHVWYVTAHRHPAARLVSGWNHLINREGMPKHNSFAPALPFPKFVDWICETPDEGMNDHFRSQVVDLVDRLAMNAIGADSRIIIFQLEQLDQCLGPVCTEYLGRSIATKPYTARRHAPWPTYYDKRMLEAVRRRFRADMALWWNLYTLGYWINHKNTPILSQIRDLHG